MIGGDANLKKGKLILLGTLLIVFSLVTWKYTINKSSQLNSEEKMNIILLVNTYYNRMMNEDYKGALELVNITKSDYDKDIEKLSNSNGYKIQQRLEGNHWIIPVNGKYNHILYDEKSRCFVVEIGANIIYNSRLWEATENVYMKKIGNNFKIIKITTDDRFASMRGSFVN